MAYYEDSDSQRAGARFIRQSMAQPMLSRELEFELARRWRHEKDEQALHQLTHSYMRLAVSVAARYRNYGLPMSDLVQEGSIGLLQAAGRFEPDRNIRFSTYATWWIRSAIQDYVLRNWSIVRTGTTASQKSLFFNLRRLRARIEETTGSELDDEGRDRIANELSVALRDVEAMEGRLSGHDQSLNAMIGETGEDEWQDFLRDERADPEERVMELHDSARRNRWLDEALGHLDRRERMIIQARRLADQAATLEELGRQLGVSKERVRQLEHRALGKLRTAILDRTTAVRDLLVDA